MHPIQTNDYTCNSFQQIAWFFTDIFQTLIHLIQSGKISAVGSKYAEMHETGTRPM